LAFGIEVTFTAIDLLVSSSEDSSDPSTTIVKSEYENFYLDIIQISLACIAMYMLLVYQKFTSRVAKRDDPF
jgi:hypothetical protein